MTKPEMQYSCKLTWLEANLRLCLHCTQIRLNVRLRFWIQSVEHPFVNKQLSNFQKTSAVYNNNLRNVQLIFQYVNPKFQIWESSASLVLFSQLIGAKREAGRRGSLWKAPRHAAQSHATPPPCSTSTEQHSIYHGNAPARVGYLRLPVRPSSCFTPESKKTEIEEEQIHKYLF